MIYLNQAATTYPKPQCVLDAYTAAFTHPPAGQYRSSSGGKDAKEACRKSLGKLLGIQETDRIFFSSGATDSSNALIYGLPLAGKTAAASHGLLLKRIFLIIFFMPHRENIHCCIPSPLLLHSSLLLQAKHRQKVSIVPQSSDTVSQTSRCM